MRIIPPTNNRLDWPRLVADAVNANSVFAEASSAEIEAITSRINTISNFASPNAGGVISGQYYDNSFQGTASTTLTGIANSIVLAPFYTSVDLPINQIGVAMSNAVADNKVKFVIYSADANGWPDAKLYESADIVAATAIFAAATLEFTFAKGAMYWIGYRSSGLGQIRAIATSSAVNLGLTSATATSYATVLRRTLAFATAAPSNWAFINGDRVANIAPPSIRMRAA